MSYILTFAGQLLCQDAAAGALCQQPIADLADCVPVQLDIAAADLRQSHDQFVRNAVPGLGQHVELGPIGRLQVVQAPDPRCISFTRGDAFLSGYGVPRLYDGAPSEWGCFLPVSAAELEVLRTILGNAWIVRSSGALIPQDTIRCDVWFTLRLGDLQLDLRNQLPFDLAAWPFRLVVLRDGWKLDELCLYRPLFYFAGFSSPLVLQELYESIGSLIDIGRYTGPILVLTDQDPTELARNMPQLSAGQLSTWYTEPTDVLGYVCARYSIVDVPRAAEFQPLIYMDADILFDADVQPMLTAVARLDRITAPIEPFSPLRTTTSVGSTLLQQDGCAPRFDLGFNAGSLGIPNLAAHGKTLRLIARIVQNIVNKEGQRQLGWIEQEVANYVSFRYADFDTHLMSRHVRYGGWPDTEPALDQRAGAVHFWPARSNALEAMRRYRQRLDAHLGLTRQP